MLGRIDYVRLRFSGDTHKRAKDAQDYEDACDMLNKGLSLTGKSYDKFQAFDHRSREWSTFFNVWGRLADAFFDWLPVRSLKDMTRLDYRVEVSNDAMDIRHIGINAVYYFDGKLSCGYLGSKPKTKRNGRDTGGPGCFIGSKDSSRRIALYERKSGYPAVETQIAGTLLPKLIQGAYDRSVALESDAKTEVKQAMELQLQQLCRERLFQPLGAFLAMEELVYITPPPTSEELILDQLSLLWDAAPETVKASFSVVIERELVQEIDSRASDEIVALAEFMSSIEGSYAEPNIDDGLGFVSEETDNNDDDNPDDGYFSGYDE